MPVEDHTINWVKSADWRYIRPTATTVTIADVGDGQNAIFHFTTTMVDIESEQFKAERGQLGSVTQIGEPQYNMKGIKMWEASVRMRGADVGGLIPVLLSLFPLFPDEVKQKIRTAIANLPA